MEKISTIGLDIAKNVFQVHAVDRSGAVVVRRQLRRNKVLPFFADLAPCLVGMEACGSAHHWARELELLGHDVRLRPPHYVKPYVNHQATEGSESSDRLPGERDRAMASQDPGEPPSGDHSGYRSDHGLCPFGHHHRRLPI